MNIEKEYLKKIMANNAKALVGKACARIEEAFDVDSNNNPVPEKYRQNLSDEQKVKAIKSALRNLIPESLREVGFHLGCYSEGKEMHKIQFKRNNPTDYK